MWEGTAFNCSNTQDEIRLRHTKFLDEHGAYGACNDGAIEGKSLGVEGGRYTSQLVVMVSSKLVGKSIMCVSDDGQYETQVDSATITITEGQLQ